MKGVTVEFAGASLTLLPERAVWWKAMRTLLVADVHLGKPHAFRAAGIPLPEGTTADDLRTLAGLCERLSPTRLVILGDLLHSRGGMDRQMIEQVTRWREAIGRVELVLIRGNHDRSAGPVPDAWRVRVEQAPLPLEGLTLLHDPNDRCDLLALAGHVHPAVRLCDFDGSRVRVPCFAVDPTRLILPAFSRFTGSMPLDPGAGFRLYACAAGRVVAVRPDPRDADRGRPTVSW